MIATSAVSMRTAVLMGIVVAAIGWMGWRLVQGTAVQSLLATPVGKSPWEKVSLETPKAGADISGLRDKPLMYATRAVYVAPPTQISVAPPAPAYKLAGTLVMPSKPTRATLVPMAGGRSIRVKPGDSLDGWTVQSVDMKRVILAFGEQRTELSRSSDAPAGRMIRGQLENGGGSSSGSGPLGETPGEGRLLASGSSSSAANALPRGKAALFSEPRLYQPPPR
jgi:hypothetical protein